MTLQPKSLLNPNIAVLVLALMAPLSGFAGLEFQDDAPQAAPVDEYTELLKEDSTQAEADFQSVRSRIRTREVTEAPNENPVQAKPAVKSAPRPAPAARSMPTETITPQGKKKSTPQVSSAEEIPAAPASESRGSVNAAFPYTHLLPGPFSLPQGSWVLGSSVAYGVFDSLELSSNIYRTTQQQWNLSAKVPMIEYPTFMATAFVSYESFNPRTFSDFNPDVRITRWQPGIVTAYEIASNMAFFIGGNFNFGTEAPKVTKTTGYIKGARAEVDWSWLYNPQSSRLGNNALSTGFTYDFTYELFGFGITHHWNAFTLGVHYTFADESRFLPIFGFTAAASF